MHLLWLKSVNSEVHMGILRTGMTALSAVAMLASASAAVAAPVRASDSLPTTYVSKSKGPLPARQGAALKDANSISPALLILILLGLAAAGYALEQAISESP
jgi:hypothetical protein